VTLRLILIRHAKSSWVDPFAEDHARVLNKRGQGAATAIGEWLAENGYIPDVILCSDAARTRETCERICAACDPAPKTRYMHRIYHAAPSTLRDLIGDQTDPNVALIGHNPGIAMLAAGLVKTPPRHPRFADYPTCATTIIDFDAQQWSALGKGTCVDFVVPRDLIGPTGGVG